MARDNPRVLANSPAFPSDPWTNEDLKAALLANPDLRFFLYSGRHDIFSPVASFREEVKFFGERITYREFAKSGHEGYFNEARIREDIRSAK